MTDQAAEPGYKKKLIEVALPLDAINAEAAREKSIRHGHPSTLHLWWARRPLAACRAVLFAQLVDDPSAHPDQFPTEEAQDAERQRLFTIIEDLVKWENTTNETVLEAARAEIRRSCDGNPPPILDPFAGGGSIPLEAQRLGLEAHASDLNPVAVLINKALIEIPPKFAGQPPVHPDAENRAVWKGAEGLAEDVRRYGQWMRDEAEKRIGHLYPKAKLPDGSEANVIAWIWARTVTCPNPACGATMPLVRSFWLGKKKGKEAWVNPIVEGKGVRFEIAHDPSGPTPEGTVDRSGAVCICCNEAVKFVHIRAEGRAGRIGAQLMAVAAEGDRRRIYFSPTTEHSDAAEVPKPASAPVSNLPDQALGFRVQMYGMTQHSDLFTSRQLIALTTFSDLVTEAGNAIEADAGAAGLGPARSSAYANAVATYLAFALSKLTDRHSTLTNWYFSRESTSSTFQRQALPMLWDFAETYPLDKNTGTYTNAVQWVSEVIDMLGPALYVGRANQEDATSQRALNASTVICTDPPYYDNIGYSDLADYFYVWLRQSLRQLYPDLFGTMVTPKSNELIATPYRHSGSRATAEKFFRDGFVQAFKAMADVHRRDLPLCLFYAFKQSETSESLKGTYSTGWAAMLEAMLAAGWAVTGTWPMRTEASNRMVAKGTNSLASSIVLSCRLRDQSGRVTDRQGLVREMEDALKSPVASAQRMGVAPVDVRQVALGPGMATFSQYSKVVEPDGSSMTVGAVLVLINQVLDTVLGESDSALDSASRWAVQWFAQHWELEGAYGDAEQLAVAMNVSIAATAESGIVEAGGGRVRLLDRTELPDNWDPASDDRIPIWEATQHLIKRLESDGEVAAARLFAQLQRRGVDLEACKALAYRLYDLAESDRPDLAGPYNMLAASWPEIQRLARDADLAPTVAEQQSFDT